MKKFLLVIFIGTVLAIDLYGIVKDLMIEEVKLVDHIEKNNSNSIYGVAYAIPFIFSTLIYIREILNNCYIFINYCYKNI